MRGERSELTGKSFYRLIASLHRREMGQDEFYLGEGGEMREAG